MGNFLEGLTLASSKSSFELDYFLQHDYWIGPQFIDENVCHGFLTFAKSTFLAGDFRQAQVGLGLGKQKRLDVRNDEINWLGNEPELLPFFNIIEDIRTQINQASMWGLFDYEGHLTHYPAGHFYKKHLDQFLAVKHRQVSMVLYLNPNWQVHDGGQLRMYLEYGHMDVLPTIGTLVVFKSDRFFHEVLPANRSRWGITGWLCHRK